MIAAPDTLHTELRESVRQYQEIKRRVETIRDGLSPEQFNWRPAGDRWSIAQNLDHLNREARVQVPVVEQMIERGRRERVWGQGPFRHSWFGDRFVAFLEPPYKVKVPAMGQFTPPSSLVAEEVAAEFMRWQDRLIDISFQAHGLHLARLTAKIPYLSRGLPALSLGQWLRYIAAHARRHLWQMEHLVLNAANFPR
jgi:hypothetical protein